MKDNTVDLVSLLSVIIITIHSKLTNIAVALFFLFINVYQYAISTIWTQCLTYCSIEWPVNQAFIVRSYT